jgi:hypothetical protein
LWMAPSSGQGTSHSLNCASHSSKRCWPFAAGYRGSGFVLWHRAESFANSTTSTAILGYNRHAERVHAMPALDPEQPTRGWLDSNLRERYGPAINHKN